MGVKVRDARGVRCRPRGREGRAWTPRENHGFGRGVELRDGARTGRARERRRTLTGALTAKRPVSAVLVTADMIEAYGTSARWM